MNKKLFSVIMGVSIVAIGLGITLSSDQSIQTQNVIDTDPSEFTNINYSDRMEATYITTDTFELRENAKNIVIGTVIDTQFVSFGDQSNLGINPETNEEYEPQFDYTTYTLSIDEQIKGETNDEIINIKSIIPTKIGFEKGDKMYLMYGESKNELLPDAGPHSFFKLIDDKAIGHEKTILIDSLLN